MMNDAIARIRSEQRRQWESGYRTPVEQLLPDESLTDEAVLDLIYSEVLLREEFGDAPLVEEYTRRFPGYSAQLARQFELHTLIKQEWEKESDASPLPRIPGYEIVRELGRGSWGVVYEGLQMSLGGRQVAIKVLRADRDQPRGELGLQREAVLAARIVHPNVAQVYECGGFEDRYFVAMELVAGGTLGDRLSNGSVSPNEAAVLMTAIARGVHQAHQEGLVHRDLKPANILLTADGTPKVVDFGLAKQLDPAAGSLAPSGTVVGTWQYMAPEQAAGTTREVGPTADVWAMGIILYELLAGQPPFRSSDPVELLRQVRFDPSPALPRMTTKLHGKSWGDLRAICSRCLEKTANARYDSAAALADDLGRWQRGEPTVARPVVWRRRAYRFFRRRPLTVTAFVILLLAVIAGTGYRGYAWYSSPFNRMSRAFARGEKAVIVGESGLPLEHRWRQWSTELGTLDDGSGTSTFRATQCSLLELVPDPGCDRYRFSAELRHLESTDAVGIVGAFVGLESFDAGEGWRADRWYEIGYSDFLIKSLGHRPSERRFDGLDQVSVSHTDGRRPSSQLQAWTSWYKAPNNAIRLPPWKLLTITVGPNNVHAEWSLVGEKPQPIPVPLPTFHALLEREQRTTQHRADLRLQAPDFRLPDAGYSARRPLGLFARRAAVAFRNVSIERIP